MRNRFWVGTSIALLSVSFIAFALMGRKPICIDSKVVEKMDRLASQSNASIYRCSLRKTVPFDQSWSDQAPELSRRISRVERFLESLQPFRNAIRINVLEDRDQTYKILDHEIFIGSSLFKSPGQLEKALIKVWFREHASLNSLDHPLFEESITDLLLFAMSGDLEIFDPGLGRDLEKFNQAWPLTLKSLPSYCQSSWRLPEHLQLCSQWVSSAHSESAAELVPASLRPLLTESFLTAYMSMSPRERRSFLKSMPSWISESSFSENGVGFSSLQEEQQSLVDLSSELSQILRSLESGKNQTYQQNFMSLVRAGLAEHGFNEEPLVASVDLWLEVQGFSEQSLFEKAAKVIHAQATDESEIRILGAAENSIYFLPQKDKLPRSLLGQVRAQKAILVTCESPKFEALENYSEMTNRLLVVQACDPQVDIPWKLYFKKDAEAFALENPSLKFVELHLPSLKLALKNQNLKPEMRLAALFAASGRGARDQLGWIAPENLQSSELVKVQSQIEAVQSYRQ